MGTATLKTPAPVPALNGLTEPVMLHQVFNPLTSPVKSIDDIVINSNSQTFDASSHRTKNRPLMKASKKFQIEEPKAGDKPAATTTGAGGGEGSSMPPPGLMAGGVPGMKGGGAANPVDGTPENGLPRSRYAMITDQVRLMPVAMKLTVDQAYVQDVLTAVANSRLRIEVTQVQEERAHGVVLTSSPAKPPEGGGGGENPMVGGGMGGSKLRPGAGFPYMGGSGSGAPRGGFPGVSIGSTGPMSGGMPNFGGSQVSGGFPGGIGGGFGSGLPGASANAGDEEDPNLVTLVIYGIATLYERYKPPASAGAKPAKP
jgi:hypothetical protein